MKYLGQSTNNNDIIAKKDLDTGLSSKVSKSGDTLNSGLVIGSSASSLLELPNQSVIKAKVTDGSSTLYPIIKAGGQVVELGSTAHLTRIYSYGRPKIYDYSQNPSFEGTAAALSDLPSVATASTTGLVKPDGTTITVDNNGAISTVLTYTSVSSPSSVSLPYYTKSEIDSMIGDVETLLTALNSGSGV